MSSILSTSVPVEKKYILTYTDLSSKGQVQIFVFKPKHRVKYLGSGTISKRKR